jgi:hypothetical protein
LTGSRSVTSLLPAPEESGGEPEVPATAGACIDWMETWVRVCEETPAFAVGQPSGMTEEQAKQSFGRGVRHLRKVRAAARSGLLRAKALEFGADLPAGFVDDPGQADRAVA